MKKKNIIIALMLLASSLLSPLFLSSNTFAEDKPKASASDSFYGLPTWYRGLNLDKEGIKSKTDIPKVIWTIVANIIDAISRIAGIVAIGFIIWAGFQYMLAAGNSGQLAAAKNTLKNAIIGLCIAVLASTIISLVITSVGGN